MADNVSYDCNADKTGKDLCLNPAAADNLRQDAYSQPVSWNTLEGKNSLGTTSTADKAADDGPSDAQCHKWNALHDSALITHIDTFTQGKFSHGGITQKDLGEMMHNDGFSAKERRELGELNRMLPEVADLFKTQDVSKAKIGAFLAWECKPGS